MSNIYSKVTIETFSKHRFSKLKNCVTRSVFGELRLKLLVATYKSDAWEQNCLWLFHYFNFERSYDILKSKSPCSLLNKNINFNEKETESKMENPTDSFRETNLMLQPI